MTGVIEWEDPPFRRGAPVHDWESIAADLQERPGKWGRVAVCASGTIAASTARYVRESQYEPLHGGVYEAVSRTVDGEARVYAKFCRYRDDADQVGEPAGELAASSDAEEGLTTT